MGRKNQAYVLCSHRAPPVVLVSNVKSWRTPGRRGVISYGIDLLHAGEIYGYLFWGIGNLSILPLYIYPSRELLIKCIILLFGRKINRIFTNLLVIWIERGCGVFSGDGGGVDPSEETELFSSWRLIYYFSAKRAGLEMVGI